MIEIEVKNDCIKCGRCVSVCPSYIFRQKEKLSEVVLHNVPICIDCGQCVAICPTDSVIHSSYPSSAIHRVRKDILPSTDSLMELLKARRSNRAMSKKPVPVDDLNKVLEAASYAPTSGNSQSLEYTLITNQDLIARLIDTTAEVIEQLVNDAENSDNPLLKQYLPYFVNVLGAHKDGLNVLLRGATSLIFIHSKNPSGASDANIAYQNASLIAESIGLAHFYTGFICIFSGMDKDNLITNLLGIDGVLYAGMGLGVPQYSFNRYVDRKEQVVTGSESFRLISKFLLFL